MARDSREVDATLEDAQAFLAALVLMAGERNGNAAFSLADLFSRRNLERCAEGLVRWASKAQNFPLETLA